MKDIDAIKNRVKKHVTLKAFLIRDKIIRSGISEEQISCPFHGQDIHKSARFYESTDTFYCWKCKKVWDLFSYLRDKNQLSFSEVLNRLLTKFKISIEDLPDALEGAIQKKIELRTSGYDRNKTILESCYRVITDLRNKVNSEKYFKLIYAYMLLKNSTPEDKFEETATLMIDALMRLKKGTVNV
jgi:DNA primase